jgi:acyl-CoA reductase-like NAD-dependent aldehyde dehydrogenase
MTVPFDWMEPKRNPDAVKAQRARRETMYRTEMEERAALLQRLGHPRESARARLAANLAWDFERGDSPIAPAQIDAILDRVYGGAPAGKPGPRAKGGAR